VSYAGTDPYGIGLDHTINYVQVDGGPAQKVALVTAPSGTVTYQAIVDSVPHTYRFFSEGIDKANNIQPAPTDPNADVVVTATFAPPTPTPTPTTTPPVTPITSGDPGTPTVTPPAPQTVAPPAPPQPIGLVVQHGAAERSHIRNVDIVFSQSDGLASLIAGNDIQLIKHNLQGQGATPIALGGLLSVVDNAIEIDFGALGLGGNPNTTAGDGYYEIDVDGSSQPYFFDRILGDVNGDGVVSQADVKLVNSSLGRMGSGLQSDVNGDGVVSKLDLKLVQHALGHKLALQKTPIKPKGGKKGH
jgi:hypothetical protein